MSWGLTFWENQSQLLSSPFFSSKCFSMCALSLHCLLNSTLTSWVSLTSFLSLASKNWKITGWPASQKQVSNFKVTVFYIMKVTYIPKAPRYMLIYLPIHPPIHPKNCLLSGQLCAWHYAEAYRLGSKEVKDVASHNHPLLWSSKRGYLP